MLAFGSPLLEVTQIALDATLGRRTAASASRVCVQIQPDTDVEDRIDRPQFSFYVYLPLFSIITMFLFV